MAFERRRLRRIIAWTASILLLLFAIFIYVTVFYTYSTGFRAGTVVKLSNKGYIFKTEEGQLYTGAISNDPNHARDLYGGNLWEFTVQSNKPEVVKAIEDAVSTGKRVKLHYHEKMYQFDWRGDTKYFVYLVEDVK